MDRKSPDGPLRLTITLPADLAEFVFAEIDRQELAGVDELVQSALRNMQKRQQRTRLRSPKPEQCDPAPLDAFLPKGTNPFQPIAAVKSDEKTSGIDFKRVQERVCSPKIPQVLR